MLRDLPPVCLMLLACSASTSRSVGSVANATGAPWGLRNPPLVEFAPGRARDAPPSVPLGWLDIVRRDALSRETAGGRLEVFLAPTPEGEGYEVRLGDEVVLRSNYELMNAGQRSGLQPWLAGSLGPVEPFDEVVLVGWSAVGNACEGYGLTLVGLRRDRTFSVADIPYCGGPEPLVETTPTQVTITIPEHPPSRGDGRIPGEIYVYAGGKVVRLR